MRSEPMLIFRDRLLTEMRGKTEGTLWRIVRFQGTVSVLIGKEGDLKVWERTEGGGFRKYPLSKGDWGNSDELKFLPLERAHSVAFFVRIHVGEMKVYPPRSLSI